MGWNFTNLILTTAFIGLEYQQFRVIGVEYFKNPYNYLDFIGYGSGLYFGLMHQIYGVMVYKDITKNALIIAQIAFGLRTISQLRIFDPFRSLIELIR